MADDYYVILGIGPDATADEVRRAYRIKARELHPDIYGEDSGPFLDLQEAYETLTDPDRRRRYDRSLRPQTSVRVRTVGGPAARRRPPVEPLQQAVPLVSDILLTRSFQTFTPSFEEIFDRLWGNFRGWPRPKAEKPEGLTIDVPVSRENATAGGIARVRIPMSRRCPTCGGRGGVGMFRCARCNGAGRLIGEVPLSMPFPANMLDGHTVSVSLERLGIRNLFLTVRFHVVQGRDRPPQ